MKQSGQSGFTLLELSVVLAVIAMITGMGIMASLNALESARIAATQTRLDEIEKALLEFRVNQGRLPCPAPNIIASNDSRFGYEATPGSCGTYDTVDNKIYYINELSGDRVAEGAVPVRTLGLPNELAHDGWGRRFTYTVMSALTSRNAFQMVQGQEQCGSDILSSSTLTDLRSNDRASYVLISAGANGYGAYKTDGSRMPTDTQNTAELMNCRCDPADPDVLNATVMQDPTSSATNPADSFDDIVRYKERWQMMGPGDEDLFSRYRPIQLVIYYSGKFVVAYTKKCDRFVSVPIDGSVPAYSGDLSFAGFSSNNRVLITYNSDNACMTHRVDDTHMEENSLLTCTFASPWEFDNHVVATRDGFLAMALPSTSSPNYLALWKQVSDGYVQQRISLGAAAPSSRPTLVAVSKNAEYVVLSDRGGYARIYKRNSANELKDVTSSLLDWWPTAHLTEFSPDGSYVAQVSGTGIYVWRNDGQGNFLGPINFGTGFGIKAIAFSPDGSYLAVANMIPNRMYDDPNPANRPVAIYKLNKLSDGNFQETEVNMPLEIWPQIGSRATLGEIIHLRFTPDSNYLLAIENNIDDDLFKAVLFKKQGDLDFTYAPAINEIVAGNPPSSAAMMH
jgi:prepilin-type N-terminal cleavage/methylation domain-containing protein